MKNHAVGYKRLDIGLKDYYMIDVADVLDLHM